MPTASTNQAPGNSSLPRSPVWQRTLRLLMTALLSFALSVLLVVMLLAKAPPVREVVFDNAGPAGDSRVYFTVVALFVALAAPLAILIYGLRHRWITWRVLGAAWALVIGTMIYLGQDDGEVIMPATLDELAPARPGDGVSYQVILRYSGKMPQQVVKLDSKILFNSPWITNLNGKESDVAVLNQNREEIETAWTQVAELHSWFTELSAFPRIGDLTQGPDASLPSFIMIRTYVRFACAKAELLALDGKGDEALGVLQQCEDVSQKLVATSRSLVRIMIGITMEKAVLDKLPFVLDHGAASAAAREQFAATLRAGQTGAAGARKMTLVDFVTYMVPSVLTHPISQMIINYHSNDLGQSLINHTLQVLDPLLMNPRATLNLAGNYFDVLAGRAAQRDIAGMAAMSDKFEVDCSGAVPMKNIGGRQILSESIPVYSKITEQYWKAQDEITAMLARLETMETAPKA